MLNSRTCVYVYGACFFCLLCVLAFPRLSCFSFFHPEVGLPFHVETNDSLSTSKPMIDFLSFPPKTTLVSSRLVLFYVVLYWELKDVTERAWVGAEFFRLPEEKQKGLLSSGNMLFCRTEPKDKQRLVKMLQDMGEVSD